MLKDLFGRKKYATVKLYDDETIEDEIIEKKELVMNSDKPTKEIGLKRINSRERINRLMDENTFLEF